MKVVFLSHRIPYPPNKGDKIRSFNLLKYLSRHHDVYLFCLIDNPDDIKYVEHLNYLASQVYFDAIKPKLKKLLSITAFLRSLPISVRYFYSITLQLALDKLLGNEDIGLVFCFCSPMAEYIFRSEHYRRSLKQARWIMDLVDVDSKKWQDYAQKAGLPQRLIYTLESRYLAKYESRVAQEFDTVLLVSEAEKALFLKKNKVNNVIALSNGVDLDYFSPNYESPIEKSSPILVFTGAMDYWPNADGVIWFATKVFPKIREKYKDAIFFVVGGNPTSEVRSLSRINGVKITGFVKDVRDYLAIADVCVVPLRIARGIQNKVLEAMAMGKPIVCTSYAAEGVSATPGEDLLIADKATEFAEHVMGLLSDHETASHLGKRARKTVEKNYRWEARLSVLDKFL